MSMSAAPNNLFDLWQAGRWRELEQSALHVLRSSAGDPSIHYLIGIARLKLEQPREAIAPLRMAVKLAPLDPAFRLGLSRALNAIGPHGRLEALSLTAQSLALNPSTFECVWALGDLIGDEPPSATSLRWLLCALRIADPSNNPQMLVVMIKCANAYRMRHKSAEALLYFQKALALDPSNVDLLRLFAVTALDLAQPILSRRFFDHALAIDPANNELRYSKGILNLACGDYKNGWPAFELRNIVYEFPDRAKLYGSPVWQKGQKIAHKTILLTAEQGIGDTIQFSRLAAQVAALNAKVLLQVQDDLVDLLTGIPGILPKQIIGQSRPVPKHEFNCSLLSLPDRLDLDLNTDPNFTPYLRAPQPLVKEWASRFDQTDANPDDIRVVISWTGNPQLFRQLVRSIPLTLLMPLFDIPGVQFIVPAHDLPKDDLEMIAGRKNILILSSLKKTRFGDVAAVVDLADLVISVDTSIAHLAGAMAKPVWIALPKSPDFRWTLQGGRTPWYPSATLIRQNRVGDWTVVIDRIKHMLLLFRDQFGR